MASHTSKAFLSLGRIYVSGLGLNSYGSRVTYATAFTTASPEGKKDNPGRNARGPIRKPKRVAGKSRSEGMPVDQDWTSVYPAAAPFRPDSVPLPVRMGYPMRGSVPPQKKGNLELIKIPNFLHLTPAAIKKHCEALKPFCTEWPSALDSDAACDKHFPIKLESTDYVSAGPSVQNALARVVHLNVKLSDLNLDEHARKKMVKLVGERYCKETDTLTIKTDSCPLRQQNQDYAMYLLTVLYHESWVLMMVVSLKHLERGLAEGLLLPRVKLLHNELHCCKKNTMKASQGSDKALPTEENYLFERNFEEGKTEVWEAEKTLADMEEYSWENSPSQKNILDVLIRMKVVGEGEGEEVREQLLGRREVQEYKDCVMRLKNEGETESSMLQYKEAVKKLLNL